MLLDLKIACRGLRARPMFAGIVLATLAIGIGANAAMFAVVNAVLLRPLPYPGSDRLLTIYSRFLPATGYDFPFFPLSGPEFDDVRRRVSAFSGVAAYELGFRTLTSAGDDAERALTMGVTPEFFEVLRVPPERGRAFTADDARPGACVAVLTHAVWQRRFAGSEAVGRTMRLDEVPCEIAGVMPPGFRFGDERVQIWTALAIDASEAPGNRGSHGLRAVARLGDDVTIEQAEAELQTLRAHWSGQFPDHYAAGHFAVLRPLRDDLVGTQRATLLLLGGAVVFVLLIVCANVAGLLLSRSEARRREFAVRRALGAARPRLIRQLVAETLVLAAGGGLLGMLVANWVLAGLLALYPDPLPASDTIAIDLETLLVAVALVVMTGLLVSLLPALHASGVQLQETLTSDGRGLTTGRPRALARSALVAGQVAFSVMLLVGALLMTRTFQNLQAVDLGIRPASLLTFGVSVPPGRQPDAAAARRRLADIEERLAVVPGVERAGAISDLPLVSAGAADDFIIDDRPDPAPGTPAWNARYVMATPGAFAALGIPLKAGRLPGDGDRAGAPPVAVINETAARLYWANENPIGSSIRYFPRETSPPIRIVGIVGDVRTLGVDVAPPPTIYAPLAQAPRPPYEGRAMTFVVRTATAGDAMVSSLRAAVASVDRGLPLANLQSMDAIVSASTGRKRFTQIVMSSFAGVGVFLAALGLYGLLAYSVEQRRREIAVRLALGANRRDVLRLVVGRGMLLAAVGLLTGIPAAMAVSRLLRGVLFGVSGTEPLMYVGVAGILGLAALLAGCLPALRATRVDPITALRAE